MHNERVHRSISDAGWSLFAPYWDDLHGDRTDEVKFWAKVARRYGRRILAPLAATGEVAAGLARSGFEVVAIDCCPEMLAIAKSKAHGLAGLSCRQGHVSDLAKVEEPFDFVFFSAGSYHHYWDTMGQLNVLSAIHGLLRPGGGFGLEMMPFLSDRPAAETIMERSEGSGPCGALQVRTEASYERGSRMLSLSQTMTIEADGQVEKHKFNIPLRMFTRVELVASLAETGFRRVAEYGSYGFQPHTPQAAQWIVVAERRAGC
jgi:SAM-dependent methyltransferase